ncbi:MULTISPECIES: Na+/H+ antiporter subunit E [Bacillus]|jgi:multicomponent Na+:H+ antiporter subunit E|uniref:Na(+) H(+) antiporter subunit E n=1 Tax=Bacillus mojavensis TaxID=72360 RepID=A0ABX6M0A0_BACMO|nr:Na+/H+ antiporter subunit E [Bacillus mojavensis]MCY8104916.1 Na+/H+ antiporter subunit E [Bacillus mojavensis]MCY8483381.1 Na+/H+ antiporter subunit E [Bacillus mojavensis]MCY9188460.1 Na+/H+ antiporter subunit E [Bacillus mojavensis]MDR4228255.1 Na+/H+ antiporter subunit E [Bacillus mojavensis]MEC1292361.1 Na+/H+ antiporter subunit E [Bacillus mojavensis]
MAFQILLNVFLAFCWMFLSNDGSAAGFITGFILGMISLFFFRRFLAHPFYLWKMFSIIKLFLIFIRELYLANVSVLKTVLSPKLDIKPGIFAFKTELTTDWEITLLSLLITLTPGTLVMDISDDRTILYIHAMDIEDAEKAIFDIRESFEKAIQEVSR